MAQNTPRSNVDYSETTGHNSQLTRRSYVRTVAAAATVITGGAATATAASADGSDYETITVSAGNREVLHVDDGETLENVLIDVTADGAGATIAAYGTEWTIRNVAVRGRVDMGDECVIGAADTGNGTSTIENVWIGDGAVPEEKGGTGIWVSPEHSGHLDIEGVNIQEMGDNAFYCSAPGTNGSGTVSLDHCYAANCWVTHFRLAEGSIENCVAYCDDAHMDGRGIWAWSPGLVTVRDCTLDMNGRHYSFQIGANGAGSTVEVYDTQWNDGFHGGIEKRNGSEITFDENCGNDPEAEVPTDCPSSLEAVFEDGDE